MFVLLNETWLNDYNKILCLFSDFTLESVERKQKKGGRVGIVISNSLDYKRRNDLEIYNLCLESCIIEIYPTKGKTIVLALLY